MVSMASVGQPVVTDLMVSSAELTWRKEPSLLTPGLASPGSWSPLLASRMGLHQRTQPPECGFPKFSNGVWKPHICQLPRRVCEEVMAERSGSKDWF